jgi:ABC-type phosphate transport system substrate-binding protein
MSVRRTIAGVISAALATSALWAAAAPAAHAADPDDTTFTPAAADLIGVGSDTSQHALRLLADAWNSTTPAPAFRLATFAATGGGDIALPSGSIGRPNGSTAGKNLLHSPSNADIDFARSSSSLSEAERNAGLQQIPFAVDQLAMMVSSTVPSNAPAALTPAQIVDIYKGNITNWSQIDATRSGVIAPKIPQAGSGTRSFFEGQLRAMNGGVAVSPLAASVTAVQEHDDTAIKSDPNAIAPFSVGRAALLGNTLRTLQGWETQRALYNVVRGPDLDDPEIQAVFGVDGFVCSDEARVLIEQAGFGQLDSEADGGVCGVQTQSPTTNFQVNREVQEVATTTTLSGTSTTPGEVVLSAAVTSDPTAQGTVSFFEGATAVGVDVPLTNGTAGATLTGVSQGTHTYRAVFTPAAGFAASEDDVTVTVAGDQPVATSISVAATPSIRKVVLKATVGPNAAAGKVTFRDGATVVAADVPVVNGVATSTVANVRAGTHSYTGSFVPADATAFAASQDTTPARVVVRTTAQISESFPAAVAKGKRARGTVTVALVGTTTKATGPVTVKLGAKVLGSGRLSNGRLTLTLKPLPRGRRTLVVTWAGNSLAARTVKRFTITQR